MALSIVQGLSPALQSKFAKYTFLCLEILIHSRLKGFMHSVQP